MDIEKVNINAITQNIVATSIAPAHTKYTIAILLIFLLKSILYGVSRSSLNEPFSTIAFNNLSQSFAIAIQVTIYIKLAAICAIVIK